MRPVIYITTMIPVELGEDTQRVAREQGMSVSAYLRELVKADHVARHGTAPVGATETKTTEHKALAAESQ